MKMPKIKLISQDKQEFLVDVAVLSVSNTVDNMIVGLGLEDRKEGNEEEIPLPNLSGSTLAKIIEWAQHDYDISQPGMNGARTAGRDKISDWEAAFMNGWNQTTLFDVIGGANYLDIKPLFDVTCIKVANMLAGKTAEEMRAVLNFKEQKFEPIHLGSENAPQIIIKCSDGTLYSVDKDVVQVIPKLRYVMEEMNVKDGEQVPFTLDYFTVVERIIEWAKYKKDNPPTHIGSDAEVDLDNLPKFEAEFLEALSDPGDLFEVISQARKLEMKDLKQLLSKKIVSMIVDKTDDEIREAFNLKNDFTEEELEWIRKENSWIQ